MKEKGRVFIFTWLDGTDHVLPKAVCARYGPSDLQVLRDMLAVPNYHGDIFHAETGRHGLNLCSDEAIRQDFQYLSAEEQQCALFHCLSSVNWDDPSLAKGNEATRLLVNRYLQWHRQHLAALVRCLDILHTSVFAARNGKHDLDLGLENSWTRLAFLLDVQFLTSQSSRARRNMNLFDEYRARGKPKTNVIFHQLDTLFNAMEKHGRMLHTKYTFVFDEAREAWTRGALYIEFQKQYKNHIPALYWKGGGANYLRSAFDKYALHWLLFKPNERFLRFEK